MRSSSFAWSCRSPRLCQELLQAIPRLSRSILHSGLEHPIEILDGFETGRDRQLRLAVPLLERRGVFDDVARHSLELKRGDDSLRQAYLPILAPEPVFGSVRIAAHVPPPTALPDVHRLDRGRLPPSSPPPRDEFRIRVCRNTTSRGALNTRDMTTCRFLRSVTAPVSDDPSVREAASRSKDSVQPCSAPSWSGPAGSPSWRSVNFVFPPSSSKVTVRSISNGVSALSPYAVAEPTRPLPSAKLSVATNFLGRTISR